MILEIYVVLLVLSLVLLFAGKFVDAPPLSFAGSVFLFLLGLSLMFGGVVYVSGEVDSYSYPVNSSLVSNITKANVYSSYSGETLLGLNLNHLYGFWLSIVGIFSFIISLANLKTDPELKRDAFSGRYDR